MCPADNVAQWNRNVGLHMRRSHGIISEKTRKYRKPKPVILEAPTTNNAPVCAVVGPGVNVIFPQEYLGDILHTLAFALSGKRDWLQVKG